MKMHEYLASLGLAVGLEDLTDKNGQLVREIEHTFYVEMADIAELSTAYQIESHEQWKLPLHEGSKIRARLRAVNERAWYLTTKSLEGQMEGCNECTTPISKVAFDHLKLGATDGYLKVRHFFRTNIDGLIYEVDVFKDRTTGKPHPWVKVDLEVKDLNLEVPKIPFKIKAFVVGDDNSVSFTDRVRIKNLWSKDWARIDDNEQGLEEAEA